MNMEYTAFILGRTRDPLGERRARMQITKIVKSRGTATHRGSTGIRLQEVQFLLKEYRKASEEHVQTKCWKRGKLAATHTTSGEGFP